MMKSSYQLAEDVYMCMANSNLVFLDLRRNQYLCLNRSNTQLAARVLSEAVTKTTFEDDRAADMHDTSRVIEVLTNKKLLVHLDHPGNGCTPISIEIPRNAILSSNGSAHDTIHLNHWIAFTAACLKASAKLRWYSMHRTVRSLANRKLTLIKDHSTDHDDLLRLVRIFHRLRPFYVRKYLCLYDSIALLEFLAGYRFFPKWVFGVNIEPFDAHCWVQGNDHILNDTFENVRTYTPIMVI